MDISKSQREEIGFDTIWDSVEKSLGKYAGSQWTDLGEHDPGITLLQAMAYAISDVSFRHAHDIKEILTKSKDANIFDMGFASHIQESPLLDEKDHADALLSLVGGGGDYLFDNVEVTRFATPTPPEKVDGNNSPITIASKATPPTPFQFFYEDGKFYFDGVSTEKSKDAPRYSAAAGFSVKFRKNPAALSRVTDAVEVIRMHFKRHGGIGEHVIRATAATLDKLSPDARAKPVFKAALKGTRVRRLNDMASAATYLPPVFAANEGVKHPPNLKVFLQPFDTRLRGLCKRLTNIREILDFRESSHFWEYTDIPGGDDVATRLKFVEYSLACIGETMPSSPQLSALSENNARQHLSLHSNYLRHIADIRRNRGKIAGRNISAAQKLIGMHLGCDGGVFGDEKNAALNRLPFYLIDYSELLPEPPVFSAVTASFTVRNRTDEVLELGLEFEPDKHGSFTPGALVTLKLKLNGDRSIDIPWALVLDAASALELMTPANAEKPSSRSVPVSDGSLFLSLRGNAFLRYELDRFENHISGTVEYSQFWLADVDRFNREGENPNHQAVEKFKRLKKLCYGVGFVTSKESSLQIDEEQIRSLLPLHANLRVHTLDDHEFKSFGEHYAIWRRQADSHLGLHSYELLKLMDIGALPGKPSGIGVWEIVKDGESEVTRENAQAKFIFHIPVQKV